MGWELANFRLDTGGQTASSFHFEVVFTGSCNQAECLYRGDGMLIPGGRVRLNREQDLAAAVDGLGLDTEAFKRHLAEWILQESQPREPSQA